MEKVDLRAELRENLADLMLYHACYISENFYESKYFEELIEVLKSNLNWYYGYWTDNLETLLSLDYNVPKNTKFRMYLDKEE